MKEGKDTTEWILAKTAAGISLLLTASGGVFAALSAKWEWVGWITAGLGGILAFLTARGYGSKRTELKVEEIKAEALKAAALANPQLPPD